MKTIPYFFYSLKPDISLIAAYLFGYRVFVYDNCVAYTVSLQAESPDVRFDLTLARKTGTGVKIEGIDPGSELGNRLALIDKRDNERAYCARLLLSPVELYTGKENWLTVGEFRAAFLQAEQYICNHMLDPAAEISPPPTTQGTAMIDTQGLTTRYGDPITMTTTKPDPKKPGRFIIHINEPELRDKVPPALMVLYAGHHGGLLEFSDGTIYTVEVVQSSRVEGFLPTLLYSASAEAQCAALDHARHATGYVWVVDDVSECYSRGTAFKNLIVLTELTRVEPLLGELGTRDYIRDPLVILTRVSEEARAAFGIDTCLSNAAYRPVEAPPLPDVPADQPEQAKADYANPDSVIPYSVIPANTRNALDCLRLAASLPLCLEVGSRVYRVTTVPMEGDAGPFLGSDTTELLSDAAYRNAQQVLAQLAQYNVARCRIRAADELSYLTLFFYRLENGADGLRYPRLTEQQVAELTASMLRQVAAESEEQTAPPAQREELPATDVSALHADLGAAFDAIYGINLPLGYSVANRCDRSIGLDFQTPPEGEPLHSDTRPDYVVLSASETVTVVLTEGGGAFRMRSPVDSFTMSYTVCQVGGNITTRTMRLGDTNIEFAADAKQDDIKAAFYIWLYRQYAHRSFDVPT